MEDPNSLSNMLAYAAIVIFLVLLALFVLRTLMLPLGVVILSAVRDRRGTGVTPEAGKAEPAQPPSVSPTAE